MNSFSFRLAFGFLAISGLGLLLSIASNWGGAFHAKGKVDLGAPIIDTIERDGYQPLPITFLGSLAGNSDGGSGSAGPMNVLQHFSKRGRDTKLDRFPSDMRDLMEASKSLDARSRGAAWDAFLSDAFSKVSFEDVAALISETTEMVSGEARSQRMSDGSTVWDKLTSRVALKALSEARTDDLIVFSAKRFADAESDEERSLSALLVAWYFFSADLTELEQLDYLGFSFKSEIQIELLTLFSRLNPKKGLEALDSNSIVISSDHDVVKTLLHRH